MTSGVRPPADEVASVMPRARVRGPPPRDQREIDARSRTWLRGKGLRRRKATTTKGRQNGLRRRKATTTKGRQNGHPSRAKRRRGQKKVNARGPTPRALHVGPTTTG